MVRLFAMAAVIVLGYMTLVFIMALVTLWASRLAIHIFRRNRGREEDFRYAAPGLAGAE